MNQGRFRDYLNYLSMDHRPHRIDCGDDHIFNHGVLVFVNPQILGAAQMDPKVVFLPPV